MIIHTFPSGLTIDTDYPFISQKYGRELRQVNNNSELAGFQDRWKYLCPSIRCIYDYDYYITFRNCNLAYYTVHITKASRDGDRKARNYEQLLSPNVLGHLKLYTQGTHIHDRKKRFMTDGYDGPDEATTFKKMLDGGRIEFNDDGYVVLYGPIDDGHGFLYEPITDNYKPVLSPLMKRSKKN